MLIATAFVVMVASASPSSPPPSRTSVEMYGLAAAWQTMGPYERAALCDYYEKYPNLAYAAISEGFRGELSETAFRSHMRIQC